VANDVAYIIREGGLVPTTHPVAKAHPELFAPESAPKAEGQVR
jgi:hypothetical protein